jgi:hypothetical protein
MSPDPFDDTPLEMDEAELDRALADDDAAALGIHLRSLLDPDTELTSRTANDVGRALRSRNTTAAALDLLGVGWWTVRALLTDDTRSADRDHEGT